MASTLSTYLPHSDLVHRGRVAVQSPPRLGLSALARHWARAWFVTSLQTQAIVMQRAYSLALAAFLKKVIV